MLGREFSLPDLNTLARLPASLQISVPEAPPQVAAALRANPRAALLASALGALLAAFALFRALAALARAAFGQRGGGEAARLQAEAAALDRQRTATAAQQECDTEAALTLQVSAARQGCRCVLAEPRFVWAIGLMRFAVHLLSFTHNPVHL